MSKRIHDPFFIQKVALKVPKSELLTHHHFAKALDEYVIGQDKAKLDVSKAIFLHLMFHARDDRKDYEKPKTNVLIVGQSGSGKTLIAKKASELLGAPSLIIDTTSITPSGWKGNDIESFFTEHAKNLAEEMGYNDRGCTHTEYLKKLSSSVIILDEFDKTLKTAKELDIQKTILKIVEGTVLHLDKDKSCPITSLDTSGMLFVLAGAFTGMLDDNIKSMDKIGFFTSNDSTNSKKSIEHQLLKTGIMPEMLGRIGIVTSVEKLSPREMIDAITKAKGNVLDSYKILFNDMRQKVNFKALDLDKLAQEAYDEGTGVRGLNNKVTRAILEQL